jgi:NTE family protein
MDQAHSRAGQQVSGHQEKPLVALVLQGGGALGAYHIGAYQALEESGYAPDWVAGISIGAINSAVIVGNRPEDRLDKLEQLWTEISWPNEWGAALDGPFRRLFNQFSAAAAFIAGQPNFWRPRLLPPTLFQELSAEEASFYDTSPMRSTLNRLVDFDLINQGMTRLSLGATDVSSGQLVFFDNTTGDAIGAEHVLASGSLPPGFSATRVGDKLYWDGGCVSNTPLDAIYHDNETTGRVLVFMIDLWSPSGEPPTNMDLVSWRQKQIQYASRSSHEIKMRAAQHNLRMALMRVTAAMPRDAFDQSGVRAAAGASSNKQIDIVHIIYHPSPDQISSSDAEFSRPSIRARREAGYEDLKLAMREQPWLGQKREPVATMVYQVDRGNVTAHMYQ